ncbi:hypothetical protein C0991_012255, partial [Blastosporella zonata]
RFATSALQELTQKLLPPTKMPSSNHNPPTFPDNLQFNGTNYTTFRDRVLIAAQLQGTKGYLTGTITQPTPQAAGTQLPPTEWYNPDPSANKWRIQNALTLALIIYNTKNPIGLGISMSDTTAVAWTTMKTTYAAVSDLATAAAKGALRKTYYTDGSSFPVKKESAAEEINHPQLLDTEVELGLWWYSVLAAC